MRSQAIAVVVSGTGGSGKTTLARLLADRMGLPHLNKDDLTAGLIRTGMSHHDASPAAIRIYYSTAQAWLSQSVSLVMDTTLSPTYSPGEVGALLRVGNVVNVHCRSANSYARWEAKMWSLYGDGAPAVIEPRREVHAAAVEPLDLGCERVEVDTFDGYRPSVQEVVRQIEDLHPGQDRRSAWRH